MPTHIRSIKVDIPNEGHCYPTMVEPETNRWYIELVYFSVTYISHVLRLDQTKKASVVSADVSTSCLAFWSSQLDSCVRHILSLAVGRRLRLRGWTLSSGQLDTLNLSRKSESIITDPK